MQLARICPCFSRALFQHTRLAFRPATTPYPHNNLLSNQYAPNAARCLWRGHCPCLSRALPTFLKPFCPFPNPEFRHNHFNKSANKCGLPAFAPALAGLYSNTLSPPFALPQHLPHNNVLSNQYAAKRRSLPVARPLPLQRRALPSNAPPTTPSTFSQTKRRAPLNAPLFPKPATCRLFIQPATLQSPPRRLPPPADAPTPP